MENQGKDEQLRKKGSSWPNKGPQALRGQLVGGWVGGRGEREHQ